MRTPRRQSGSPKAAFAIWGANNRSRRLAPCSLVLSFPCSLSLSRRRAVSRALHHAQKTHPRPHRFLILIGHDPRYLVQMRQVVRRPCRQQLRERHLAQCVMPSAPLKILLRQTKTPHLIKIFRANTRKFVEQLAQLLAPAVAHMAFAIERRKRLRVARSQNQPHPRRPIVVFRVDQVRDNRIHAPRITAFIAVRPPLGQIAQKRIQSSRRPCKSAIVYSRFCSIVPLLGRMSLGSRFYLPNKCIALFSRSLVPLFSWFLVPLFSRSLVLSSRATRYEFPPSPDPDS